MNCRLKRKSLHLVDRNVAPELQGFFHDGRPVFEVGRELDVEANVGLAVVQLEVLEVDFEQSAVAQLARVRHPVVVHLDQRIFGYTWPRLYRPRSGLRFLPFGSTRCWSGWPRESRPGRSRTPSFPASGFLFGFRNPRDSYLVVHDFELGQEEHICLVQVGHCERYRVVFLLFILRMIYFYQKTF